MSGRYLAVVVLCCAVSATCAHAAPSLSVTPTGDNGAGDRAWLVEVTPDPVDVSNGSGSIAVELAFAIDDTDLLGVDVNTAAWDHENPGSNPFTGTVTDGLWLDLIGDRTFGAFGSINFSTADPVELFTIETAGLGRTTLRYGEAASGDPVLGARMAQNAVNYDGYTGSVTVPEPASIGLTLLGLLVIGVAARRRAA